MKTYKLTFIAALFVAAPVALFGQQFVSNLMPKDATKIKKESPAVVLPDSKEFVWLDQEAKPLNLTTVVKTITYPDELLSAGFEPLVQVRVLVDKNGLPLKHVWVSELDPTLKKVVSEAIPAIRFAPAEIGGESVASWMSLAFRFKIR
ncbi:MAG: energy transducer TonB [Bacteroidota bacterium]